MALPPQTKATKYEHILPQLAAIRDNDEIDGLLILLNTVGGDIEAGLAIAEMIAYLGKPSVSLGSGGWTFHRRTAGGVDELFFHRADGNHDHPSDSHVGTGHWSCPNL